MMLTPDGPKVVEFNVRFGDPETQVVLPRWEGDVAAILAEAAAGHLVSEPSFTPQSCVCVVLCSEGYPGAPRTGDPITGIQDAEQLPGVAVFHAGTAAGAGGGVVTAGGRVLNVTALAPSLREARNRAYEAVGKINWPGIHFRHDIAAVAAEEDT